MDFVQCIIKLAPAPRQVSDINGFRVFDKAYNFTKKERCHIGIKILDAPMGAGKTSAMINYMNAAPPGRRFVFVTPFLTEGERVTEACPGLDFQTPESGDGGETADGKPRSKLVDFKKFIKAKKNIVTTHALFERFDPETVQLIAEAGYTMILDEVIGVVSKYDISPKDARTINAMFAEADDGGRLTWKESERDYWGDYAKHKMLCDNENLWKYKETVLMQVVPINAFAAFDDVFVLTYMFDAQLQRAYFDMFELEYEYVYVEGGSPDTYRITDKKREYRIPNLKEKIHICQDKKLNLIGQMQEKRGEVYSLSVGWFEDEKNAELIKGLKNNVYNYFRHHMGAVADDVLWTSFKRRKKAGDPDDKEREPYFTPRSYSSGFLACNSRATNAYRTRKVLAYPINRFLAPEIVNFLHAHGVRVDTKRWALSEMIQWIWRSAIRDGQEIWIYVPSKRMRTLLENWIDEVTAEGAVTHELAGGGNEAMAVSLEENAGVEMAPTGAERPQEEDVA